MIRHAGLVAARVGGSWRGVLIEGPAGAGKSDLAIRALAHGFRLVADDRVTLWVSAGRLFGRAPEALVGLLEIRGLQVVRVAALPLAEVALVVRCGTPERIPDPAFAELLGVSVPLIGLDLREASAPAKLSRALSHFDERGKRRI
ncbi:MAG: serine kinase of the HPr protein regulates carbohydrate metabolism [Phenylobacterium sp.]|nr:serine kinase of the HPr protein regulates carbohydrate metabolism [Phenylobacterium sp.]